MFDRNSSSNVSFSEQSETNSELKLTGGISEPQFQEISFIERSSPETLNAAFQTSSSESKSHPFFLDLPKLCKEKQTRRESHNSIKMPVDLAFKTPKFINRSPNIKRQEGYGVPRTERLAKSRNKIITNQENCPPSTSNIELELELLNQKSRKDIERNKFCKTPARLLPLQVCASASGSPSSRTKLYKSPQRLELIENQYSPQFLNISEIERDSGRLTTFASEDPFRNLQNCNLQIQEIPCIDTTLARSSLSGTQRDKSPSQLRKQATTQVYSYIHKTTSNIRTLKQDISRLNLKYEKLKLSNLQIGQKLQKYSSGALSERKLK